MEKYIKFKEVKEIIRDHFAPAKFDQFNTGSYRSYLSRWVRVEIKRIVTAQKKGRFIYGPSGTKTVGVILRCSAPTKKAKPKKTLKDYVDDMKPEVEVVEVEVDPIRKEHSKCWHNKREIELHAKKISREIQSYIKQTTFKGTWETSAIQIETGQMFLLIDAWNELRNILDPQ